LEENRLGCWLGHWLNCSSHSGRVEIPDLGLTDLLQDRVLHLPWLDLLRWHLEIVIAGSADHLTLGAGTGFCLVALPCADGLRTLAQAVLLTGGLAARLIANCLARATTGTITAASTGAGAEYLAIRLFAFDSAGRLDDGLAICFAGGRRTHGRAYLLAYGIVTFPIAQRLALLAGFVNHPSISFSSCFLFWCCLFLNWSFGLSGWFFSSFRRCCNSSLSWCCLRLGGFLADVLEEGVGQNCR